MDEMIEMLECELKRYLETGLENVDADEAGKVTDMIKDLYQAKKYCIEHEYYETIIEAMGNGKEVPFKPMVDQTPYVKSTLENRSMM